MDRIGVRELRQNASQYLARVAASREPIEITDRGRPIARLVPIIGNAWDNLIAAGEIDPGDSDVDVRRLSPVTGDYNGTEVLQELREHER